ncbi:fibronectin type III domain-containing protein [Winogradskyella thalassocola]|uniref:Fibronectin type-III domain-containing protein n=1 Tax=Winogradskyella thalassocola TaxID=262004 RepID=A0A1G8GRU5_9FLAO|nr:fibronectin type III domain-containing protein [Winogradskyella thalassocola]SDH97112.1 hypothetical protein SAMN04489796_10610 [Winogradskyella thalassocola]
MKNLKIVSLIFALSTALLMTNCSSSDDINNNPPGIFSANALGTGIDSGNVEWTEAIDPDDDSVTYNVYLEGELIAAGGTTFTYTFSGLEPETIYEGYVEARDGRGGTSIAEFSFVTEPEVIIFNVDATWWFYDQYSEGGGLRSLFRGGFVIPYYEDATTYQIEILDYGWVSDTYSIGNTHIGSIYTWTNDSQSTPIGAVFADQPSDGDYSAALTSTSVNTIGSGFDVALGNYETIYGEARVTIIIGN